MLYFVDSAGDTIARWHVGESPLPVGRYEIDISRVSCIQADGDELDYIRDTFKNIPDTRKRVVIWCGDTARFIILNLSLIFQKKES